MIKIPGLDKVDWALVLLFVLCAAAIFVVFLGPAGADDHVIRPTCWEENVNGEVQRHCEVVRDSKSPAPLPPQPHVAAAPPPPPPPAYYPPPPPPVRPWPTQNCHYSYPCPVYYDRFPAPVYGPMPPAFPPPPVYPRYWGPPGFFFGFGPFTFIVP